MAVSGCWWLQAAALVAVFASAWLYYFCTCTFGYWRRRGVPCPRATPLFGSMLPLVLGTEHRITLFNRLYREFRGHRYGGFYQMRTPFLMVCDPELINRVLIRDFSHFTDHGLFRDPTVNPLANTLLNMRGNQWKVMRNKISPVFTSGKLKLMHDQISECSGQMMANVTQALRSNADCIEVRNELGKYSTDVIGTCAFGLQLNAINDERSEFREHGKSVFRPSLLVLVRDLAWMVSPALRKMLPINDFAQDTIDFFVSAFTDTMRYRERNGITRNDVMQTLIQARTDLVVNKTEPSVIYREEDIVANAFVLFVAGFETVSTTMSFCLYELALKKHIQDKVRQEMISMKSKHAEINNDFLMDLHYLEMVLAETLRKYPTFLTLFREATQTYQVPDDTLVIEKGTKIIIPTYSIHYDYRYYPDPETFDPERFTPEEKAKRPSGTYMPFGDGPRICIGKRFAEMEMKLALTELLTKYEVEPCEKTDILMKYNKRSIIVIPENGIWLKFKPIKSETQ